MYIFTADYNVAFVVSTKEILKSCLFEKALKT